MKFKRTTKVEYGLKQIDIAPLVDVIFLLLIFFMLTSSFVVDTGIDIKLPKAVTSDVMDQNFVSVALSDENVLYLNGKVSTLEELEEYFKSLTNKSVPVLIKADKRASVGRVVEVWDICRKIGLEKINVATNQ